MTGYQVFLWRKNSQHIKFSSSLIEFVDREGKQDAVRYKYVETFPNFYYTGSKCAL